MLDDLSSGRRENLEGALGRRGRARRGRHHRPGRVAAAFEDAEPELVFHLAAQIDVRRSVDDPAFDLGVNVGGTINLLEAARAPATPSASSSPPPAARSTARARAASCRSTRTPSAAPTRPTARASSRPRATSPLPRLYGLSTVALRLGNVYGPRQDPHGEAGVVAIFSGALLGGGTPRVFGDGEQTRDYIYVGDVVERVPRRGGSRGDGRVQRRHRRRDQRPRARASGSPRLCERGLRARDGAGPRRRGAADLDRLARAPGRAGLAAGRDLGDGLPVTVDSFRRLTSARARSCS